MVPNFVWGVCLYTGGWGQTLEKMGIIYTSSNVCRILWMLNHSLGGAGWVGVTL